MCMTTTCGLNFVCGRSFYDYLIHDARKEITVIVRQNHITATAEWNQSTRVYDTMGVDKSSPNGAMQLKGRGNPGC